MLARNTGSAQQAFVAAERLDFSSGSANAFKCLYRISGSAQLALVFSDICFRTRGSEHLVFPLAAIWERIIGSAYFAFIVAELFARTAGSAWLAFVLAAIWDRTSGSEYFAFIVADIFDFDSQDRLKPRFDPAVGVKLYPCVPVAPVSSIHRCSVTINSSIPQK